MGNVATSAPVPRQIRAEPRARCPSCGGAGGWIHDGLVDRSSDAPGVWGYRRCADDSCALVWLDPMPLEEDLALAYRDYYTHVADGPAAGGTERARRARGVWGLAEALWHAGGVARSRARLDGLLLDDRPPGRVLEIGCGNGERLALLRARGWEVEGQEIDPIAAERARHRLGVTIHLGPLAVLALPDSSYDAIASSHVLEHVHDPEALLRACRRLLRADGVLTAITPNAASIGHRVFGRDWFYLDPPRHLHLFTMRALATLARRSGFRPVVWTTAARAQIVAAGSLDLRRGTGRGRHVVARSARDLGAVAGQLVAQIFVLASRGAGEECVLVATPAS